MNDTVVARPCWTVLTKKAEDKIALIQNELVQARTRLESLRTSEQRVQKMYDEYRDGLNRADGQSLGMREAMNQRQFMSQLLTLRERVERDIATSQLHLQTLAHRMLQAEAERLKMKTLTENDRLAVQKHVNKREQHSMDELGMLQFNQARAA
jgi:flagellar export protein FliJ